MLNTRLKLQCFLVLFLYSLTLTESQVVVDPDSQWPVLDYGKYPPKENDEAYLYYMGQKKTLSGLKIQVNSLPEMFPNETLVSATASFEYWGRGGVAVTDEATAGYIGSTFFRLGVSFRAEDRPETNWAPFMGTNGTLNENKWRNLTVTDTQALYPARIMINPVLGNTDPTGEYYVALRSIQVTYIFNQTVPEVIPVANNETDANSTAIAPEPIPENAERTVVLTCTVEDCSAFMVSAGDWSSTGFPVFPTGLGFERFLAATPDGKPYKFSLTKPAGQDVCVSISYWITEAASLSIGLAGSTRSEVIVLKPTFATTSGNSLYEWYNTIGCLDSFLFNLTEEAYEVTLTPVGNNETGQFIAISEITTTSLTPSNLKPLMVLDNWSKPVSTEQWFVLPEELISAEDFGYSFQILANKSGRAYLFSEWFTYVEGHQLRQELEITSCSAKVMVSVHLLNGTNGLVQTLGSNLCQDNNGSLLMNSTEVHTLTGGNVGKVYRLQYQVDWMGSEQDQTLIIRDVDLSDACRLGRGECNNQGECKNIKPNQAECGCDVEYFGDKCDRVNWCERGYNYSDTEVNVNGSSYCTERDGECNREVFNPITHTICACGSTKFWKHDDNKTWICEDLDPCAGLNAFCPIGYKCSSDNVTRQTNCNDCEVGWVSSMVNGTTKVCQKYDPCSDSTCLPGSLCKEYMGNEVCYCDNGVQYSNSTGCSTASCNLWVREELGCHHSCFTEREETNCTCYKGWELLDDGKGCNMTFERNVTCQEHSVAVNDSNVFGCQCLPGFTEVVEANVTKCIDVCTYTDAGHVSDEVTTLCGAGSSCSFDMTSGHVTCKCDPPYVNGPDGRCHIDETCTGPEGKGFLACQALGAVCIPRVEWVASGRDGYECRCPLGTKESANGTCIDQCNPDEKKCLFENAVCQRSLDLAITEPSCVCQPGLKKSATQSQCYLIENSIRAETVMRLDSRMIDEKTTRSVLTLFKSYLAVKEEPSDTCSRYSPKDISGCIDYLTKSAEAKAEAQKPALVEKAIRETLVNKLQTDLVGVFGQIIGKVDVIHFEKVPDSAEGDYKVTVTMEQTSPSEPNYRLDLAEGCHDYPADSAAKGYCLIPQNSVFLKSTIQQEPFKPCNETMIDYCPSNTRCIPSSGNSKFSCECNPGFKAEVILQMNMNDRDNFKEHCEDIDECTQGNVCPTGSYCINTVGSYLCPCGRGYRQGPTGCIDICQNMECVYGECRIVTNNTGICSCQEGYRGDKCDEQDPVVKTFKTALITVAVVLGLLLIGVVVVAVVLIKKTKKSAKKSGSQRAMGEYGRPKVPQRYQDNSGFTDD